MTTEKCLLIYQLDQSISSIGTYTEKTVTYHSHTQVIPIYVPGQWISDHLLKLSQDQKYGTPSENQTHYWWSACSAC